METQDGLFLSSHSHQARPRGSLMRCILQARAIIGSVEF